MKLSLIPQLSGRYAIHISGDVAQLPAYVVFNQPHINTGVAKAVNIVQGTSIIFKEPFFAGAMTTAGFFTIGANAVAASIYGYEGNIGTTGLLIDGAGSGHMTRYLQSATSVPGLVIVGGVLRTPIQKIPTVAAVSRALTHAEMSGGLITNQGQAAADVTISLDCVGGYAGDEFIAVVATAQAANFWRFYTPAGSNIYINGAIKTWIQQAAPVIGSAIKFTRVDTDIYGWVATPLNGVWTTN